MCKREIFYRKLSRLWLRISGLFVKYPYSVCSGFANPVCSSPSTDASGHTINAAAREREESLARLSARGLDMGNSGWGENGR